MIRPYNGLNPTIGRGVFVAPSAEVMGDVEIGDDSSIWYQAVVRGDVNSIKIGAATNIQDGCVLHVTAAQWSLRIGDNVTVGHRVVLHGARVGSNVLVGIGSVVLDGAVIEDNSIVGAGSLVTPGFRVPSGTIVVGLPARIKRELRPQELEQIRESAENYVKYAKEHNILARA
ncbi:MAG: gamma carbonic anhydrase family protein [Candidatus Dadabacteria bacterium]|nr:gamma carbonic anhydrase family protein [Candidatus Dadabacteria bacterium]